MAGNLDDLAAFIEDEMNDGDTDIQGKSKIDKKTPASVSPSSPKPSVVTFMPTASTPEKKIQKKRKEIEKKKKNLIPWILLIHQIILPKPHAQKS